MPPTTPTIPAIVSDYFTAANRHDTDAVVRCFSPDATVHDDGHYHHGHAAIGSWTAASSLQYQATITPLGVQNEGAASVVDCRVAGDFTGSPVALQFAFTLEAGAIASLEVSA